MITHEGLGVQSRRAGNAHGGAEYAQTPVTAEKPHPATYKRHVARGGRDVSQPPGTAGVEVVIIGERQFGTKTEAACIARGLSGYSRTTWEVVSRFDSDRTIIESRRTLL